MWIKSRALSICLNTSFSGEIDDYSFTESIKSRHNWCCIMDELLSLSTQKYAEVFQAHQAYIASFLWYMLSVFWWHRISFLEEKQGVIKMSMKDKFLILLEVVSKPNIYMLISPKPVNNHTHDLKLRMVLKDRL